MRHYLIVQTIHIISKVNPLRLLIVGCQNTTAKNQSLREERSSTGTQHFNLLFKYQVETSTPVSEQEPRHMEALQYRLNCQEADIKAQMPASPRPRRLHHWGSNALIYIAQECTTRGLRCLHLHVQEHNSRCVRLRRCPRRRELKKMPASPRHTRVQGYPRRPRHTRVCPLRASKRCPRWPRHS